MEGFAEGFLGGFNSVDNALSRREQLRQQKERDAAADRQFQQRMGLENAQLDATKQHYKDTADYQNNKLSEDKRQYDSRLDFDKQKEANDEEHRKFQERIDSARVGMEQQRLGLAAAEHSARMAEHSWKFAQEKRAQAQQEAAQRLNYNIMLDPATGSAKLNVPKGHEKQFIEDAKTLGVPIESFANIDGYQNDINTLKVALAHDDRDGFTKQHGGAILGSFNRVFGNAINQGLGKYNGSDPNLKNAYIIKKEAVNIQPSVDDKGRKVGDEHYVTIREYYGDKNGKPITGKDGQPLFSDGPMTVGRNGDPDAPIKALTPESMIKAINMNQQIVDSLRASPEAQNHLHRILKPAKETEHDYKAIKLQNDMDGTEELVLYDSKTGNIKGNEDADMKAIANPPPKKEEPMQQPEQPEQRDSLAWLDKVTKPASKPEAKPTTDRLTMSAQSYLKHGTSGNSPLAKTIENIRSKQLPEESKIEMIKQILSSSGEY